MYRKLITSALLSLVVLGGFFADVNVNSEGTLSWVSESYAATCGGPDQPKCTEDEAIKAQYNEWVVTLNQALYFLTFAVSPAVMLAGWLMSPDWTSGDLFGIRPVLHDLWVVISNITYFIYALLLIFIALATIFNSQNYGYKKLLPRLALGIVLVPLTWWFVQFIISLSSIVTASVINIPLETLIRIEQKKSPGTETWLSKPTIPKQIIHDAAWGNGTIQVRAEDCDATKCVSPKDILTDSTGMFGGLMVYAYGIFRFQDNFQINTTTDLVKVVAQLVHQGLIMALMFLVFGFLIIALVFMLLMRAIKLWFYAIFSPLMTLRYVIGDGFFGGKDNGEGFEIKEFVGLAFVPALVGMALSLGIVIIAVLHFTGASNGSGPPTNDCLTNGGCKVTLMGNPSNSILTTLQDDKDEDGNVIGQYTQTVITFGGVEYIYYGSVSGITGSMGKALPSALSAAGGVFGTIIIDIIALIFIWSAFMVGKNISKVAKAAFAPFESIGNKFGKMAMDIPKYTPIPGTGGLSLKGAEKVMTNAERAIDLKHEEAFKQSDYGKLFGGDRFISKTQEDKMIQAIKAGKRDDLQNGVRANANIAEGHRGEQVTAFRDHLNSMGSRDDRKRYLEQLRIEPDMQKKILDFMDSSAKSKLSSEADRKELWDIMKEAVGASSSGKGGNSSPSTSLTPTNDGRGFNIGTVNIAESLSSNPDVLAAKLKLNGAGGGGSLKGLFTADEFKAIMGQATQFRTEEGKQKLEKLIQELGKDYFKDDTASASGKKKDETPPGDSNKGQAQKNSDTDSGAP